MLHAAELALQLGEFSIDGVALFPTQGAALGYVLPP